MAALTSNTCAAPAAPAPAAAAVVAVGRPAAGARPSGERAAPRRRARGSAAHWVGAMAGASVEGAPVAAAHEAAHVLLLLLPMRVPTQSAVAHLVIPLGTHHGLRGTAAATAIEEGEHGRQVGRLRILLRSLGLPCSCAGSQRGGRASAAGEVLLHAGWWR